MTMTCPTCAAPITAEHPTITLANGAVYHAPMWWREPLPPDAPEDTPPNEPVLLFPDCAPVPEPGEPAPPQPPAPRTTLSLLEFTRRFTMTENATINYVRLNPATPLMVRAQLETLQQYLERATMIDTTDADTIAGVDVALGVLQQAGVLTAAQAPDRRAAILAPAGNA
jgi:hypothetical protein